MLRSREGGPVKRGRLSQNRAFAVHAKAHRIRWFPVAHPRRVARESGAPKALSSLRNDAMELRLPHTAVVKRSRYENELVADRGAQQK
jgi:hypothetical protein